MAGCSIQLLGGFKITFDNEDFTTTTSGAKARLLAYVVLAFDMPQTRKQIAFDFWPDSTEKQALSNLRKLLHDLRECLPQTDRYLKITPAYIQWNLELPVYLDVREFEQGAVGRTLYELRKAEELYRGDLLPGLQEEWLGAKREQLAQTYSSVLDKLISIMENQREYTSALLFANKMLVLNQLREETYRTLMRLHALNNDMAGVVRIYQQLYNILQDELGIGPAEETLQLVERLTKIGNEQLISKQSKTPLVGRIGEWENMVSKWKQATIGRNSLLLLKGETGIGKTRLTLEFKAWVERQGYQTAFAGCYPSVRSLSYTPITAWLRSVPLPQIGPVWLSELTRLLPELFERYPELPKPDPIQDNWQLNQWYEAIERMLLGQQPLLLLIDDIQWSDGETLQFLSYLLRKDTKLKLLVVATMRTEDLPGDAVGHFVFVLRNERKLTEIELAPFGEDETKQLMAATVGDELADCHSSNLYAEIGGNPLYIMETLKEWKTGSDKMEFRFSPLVKSIILNRLKKLSPDNRHLVSIFAAVGRPVSLSLLAMLTGSCEEEISEKMEHLVQSKVMQETEDEKYDFTHDILRESAYTLKNESLRRQYHRKIAIGLIAFHQERLEAVAAEIAFHYELALMKKEAILYYEMAASVAEKIYANETRIKCYRKLISLLPPEQILPILMKLGDVLIITGNWNEAEKTYRQWLEQEGNSTELQERSFCDVALGNCLRLQGKYEEASFHLERARRHFELIDDHSGLGFAYGTLGMLHYYRGNNDKALHYLTVRMELPPSGDRTREDCRFYGVMGGLFYHQCEFDQAIHAYKMQLKLATENRDKNAVAKALGGLALVYLDTDQTNLAFDCIVDKIEISQVIGDRMGLTIAMGMLGKYYGFLGSHTIAAGCIAFCLEEAIAVKDWRFTANLLGWEAHNLLLQFRVEEAIPFIDRSLRLSRQLRSPFFECNALYLMSVKSYHQNQYDYAVEIAEEALKIANKLNRRDMQLKLLLHLNVGLRRTNPIEALEQLHKLLKQYVDQQEQAAIYYAMWKLNSESSEYRINALSLNEELYRKSGKEEYRVRCSEMNGLCDVAAVVRPMPQFAAEVTQHKSITETILKEIDCYLKLKS
ncbi:tetratricopeptide repeat protein [Paenibacillus qinlingensis]|uniref:tetratricopeptide repeat protein n=1 Tax=Paenibacillus qinlingensis TaxID=1837343 RepID=UPI0015649C6A|nr:tetratricopeptide repeat protein [Paenibacillus qinlingensis]NQX63677.1 tetratricopeptide repeat protein [Paenibacillus qinlingensis]